MGIINNMKNAAKNGAKKKAKKAAMKFLKGMFKKSLFKPILIGIIVVLVIAALDNGAEIGFGEATPELVYDTLEVEDIADLVEIKPNVDGGYYLDFVEGIDEKLQEIVNKASGGNYHNLPANIEFLKDMLKAEVYTQFPDLGGSVTGGTDGFQGAVKIRRVTPNKDVGEMKNTGKGETSNLEQGSVSEPEQVEDRNDQHKIESWSAGQRLSIVVSQANLYEDQHNIGYWEPIMMEGSTTQEVKLQRNDVVIYQGDYKIDNNALTGTQTIYLKVKTEDDLEGYVKSTTVIASLDGATQGTLEDNSDTVRVATTSRDEDTRKTIGERDKEYVVAIAAGRNNSDDTGIFNEEKELVEEELTIEVAERVEELLDEYSNIKVVQTGSTSRNPDGVKPEDRIEKARDASPDLCIQIYFSNGEEAGVQTIFKEGDQYSQQLADILAENISASMGINNLLSIADTAKYTDEDGNSASLDIIDNTAVAGFPSIVALGGNLNKDPDASIIAGDGVEKYAQGIVDGIDEYFKADHTGLTATDQGEVTYTSSVESRIINMKYVPQDTMQEYIDDGNLEEAIKCYTIDDDKNIVIATWSQKEDGSVEIKTTNSMNLKTALEKYVMPFEYLLYFYIDTDYTGFVNDLIDEVMNSEIVVAVQDEITTTHTDEYKDTRMEASPNEFTTGYPESPTLSKSFTTESVSTKINLTYVQTWFVKTYQENSYSEAVLEIGDETEKIVEVPGKVTQSGPASSTSETTLSSNLQGRVTRNKTDENGNVVRDEEGNIETEVIYYTYDILERTITSVESISNTYEKGEYKTEGRENVFVKLYNKHDMITRVRTSDYLFTIIENNERTANLLDLTKYLLYKSTNILYGVGTFDFSIYDLSNFQDTGTGMGGLETFKEYLHSWEGHTGLSEDGTKYRVGDDGAGHPTVGYGIDIYNSGFLDRFLAAGYDVSIGSYIDVEFVDALEDEEIQSAIQTVENKCAGLNLTIYQKYALVSRIYNCGSSGAFTSRNGKTFVEAYNAYWDPEKDDEYGVTTNDSMYNHSLYTTYMSKPVTSGGMYMRGLELRRKSEWILFKTGYYDRIDKWCSQTGSGGIVEKAVECHRYLRENGYYYAQAGVNIPITGSGRTIDCSSFVSWVLYEAGYTEMEGYQQTSATFRDNKWGWQEVSVSEAQPGDLLLYSGHVEIVAGDAGDRFLVYNCGGNESINAQGTAELPESSRSGYTKGQILKILRPSQ